MRGKEYRNYTYYMTSANTEKLLNQILSILTPRQKEVIQRRYGLKDGKSITLA